MKPKKQTWETCKCGHSDIHHQPKCKHTHCTCGGFKPKEEKEEVKKCHH